jgi:hypothetical protein
MTSSSLGIELHLPTPYRLVVPLHARLRRVDFDTAAAAALHFLCALFGLGRKVRKRLRERRTPAAESGQAGLGNEAFEETR